MVNENFFNFFSVYPRRCPTPDVRIDPANRHEPGWVVLVPVSGNRELNAND